MATRSKVPKTTIIDIAAASGVSVATVSRILNNKPDVADETRERVLRVMDEIGFAPQSAWRQIRSGRTGLIAMHVPQEFNPPAHRLIMAAALGVEDAGYSINVITRPLTEGELLAIFRGREADGIILLEILTDDRRAGILRDNGYPFVMIGHRADNEGLSFVDIDVAHGIDLAVDHLVTLGHRRIGFVAIDPVVEDRTYGFATWALEGYAKACKTRGLEPLARVAGPSSDDLAQAARGLLEEHPDVTALIAPQEQSVIGVLKAIRAKGLRVPEDISVIGMISDLMAEIGTPPLTTVGFPAEEMGAAAAQILIPRVDAGPTPPTQLFIEPELTVRGTTGRPGPRR